MRNSSKKLLAFLLVFIMLFAASATVISAAYEQNGSAVEQQEENEAVKEGTFSLEWFEVSYIGNDIVVTVKPQYAEEILSLSRADIEQLIRFALEVSKEVVLDDFVEALAGTGEHVSAVEFGKTVINNTLDIYLQNNYGAADHDAFIRFFEDVMAGDNEVIEFSEFFCALIDAAVISRTVAASEFPTPEEFDGEMDKLLTENKYDVISTYFDEQFAQYKAYKTDKTGTAAAPALLGIIDNYAKSYIKSYLMSSEGKSEAEADHIIETYAFTADDYINFFASASFNQEAIRDKVTEDTAALDKAMLATVGCTFTDIDARIAEVEDILHADYVAVYNRITTGETGIKDLVKLLDLVDYININDYVLYGDVNGKGKAFYTDTVKQLIKDLPMFEEIANMENDEMQLAYEFEIASLVGNSEFSVTFKLGGGYEKVRKIARIIADNVTFKYYGGGTFELDVNVPDELARAALKACNSDKVSDEIKHKVFAAFSKNPDDIYAFVKDVSLDELLQIFDYIDFEGILDSEYLSRFEKLDGLTEEQIKNKIKEYERYYDKAISIMKRAYGYVPASVKEKTLFDFYNGNGEFSAQGDATIDIVKVAGKVSETLADFVDGFLDDTVVTVDATVNIKFEDVYRVTYYKGDELVRDGFLPVGANVDFFSGETEYNGHPIIAWVDANGVAYTEMPEADVELYAVTATVSASLTASANEKVYDGQPIELVAEATPNYPTATYSYVWYKDNVVIDGATANTITVTDVKDSGTYYCEITVVDYGIETVLTTNKETVNITKKGIALSDAIEWTNEGPFTYDGGKHGVSVAVKAEYASLVSLISISGNEATDAKNYNAVAKFTVIDPNYEFTGSDESAMTWIINPKTFSDSDITWVGGSFEYAYGKEHSVSATYPTELNVVITDNKATNAGNYTAKAVVTIADGNTNYAWAGSAVVEYAWTVAPKAIDLSAFAWIAYNSKDPNHNPANFAFVYNGDAQGVKITDLPEDIALAIVYTNASATNATEKNLIAKVAIDDAAYTALTGASVYNNYNVATDSTGAYKAFAEKEWGIAKAVITVDSFTWINYSGIVYNGQNHTPTLNITASDLNVKYVYEVRLQDGTYRELIAPDMPNKAGHYRASVSITPIDTENYKVDSRIEMSIEFDIAKKAIAIDGIKWDYTDAFTYNGKDYTVNLDTSVLTAEELALVNIIGNTDTKIDAGNYTAKAILSLVDSENYVFTVAGAPVVEPVEYELAWIINKATVSLGDYKWNYDADKAPVYNGKEFKVELDTTGISDMVEVKYSDNVAINAANNYYATATIYLLPAFDNNYKIDDNAKVFYTLEWEIKKATTYGATFSDATFEFDAQEHSIFVEGTLPDGVTVTYDGNGVIGIGKHLVTATISESANYEAEALTAYITITPYSTDTLVNQFQNGYLVIVTVNGGGIASGYEFNSSIVSDAYANIDLTAIAREGYNVKLARAYEINFTYAGYETDLNGDFTVRICIPTESFGAEDGNLAIVYIAEDGTIETVEGIRSGNYMLFDTTHFSVYGIVEYTEIVEEEPEEPFVCPGHEDSNGDGKCDHCGEDYTTPPFVCPGHEDNDFDGKCDHCAEGMEIPPECTHVDNNLDGKCDKCGEDLSVDEPVIKPDTTDNTWVWILIAIIVAVIIALLIFVVMKKNDDEDDGYTEPTPIAPTDEDNSEEEAPVEEAPVEEAPVDEAPVEEAPVEEASVEEAPVEEAPVEEAPVEEAPAEEAPVEVAPVEETPAEPAGPSYAEIFAASENADAVRLVNGVVVPVRYRTSFMSRLIQSEEPIQTYYTIVKNYLLSFKGVKARTSWNFESFNKGRIQCAKLNVKGSAFQVYLGLDTNEYSEDKYHFVNVGDKPKLDKVPMMMKVKSERSLKYTLELIDEVMRKNGIEQTAVPEVDYHMPYESTEALVDKDLVKVILPDGMEIDENTIIEKVNVGNLLKDVKPEDEVVAEVAPVEEAPVEEAPVEEVPVEEAPVEEVPVEEAPVEEVPVEEAPVEEAPVEEAPVEEAPAEEISQVHIVDHHVLEEEIVQVDSVKADVIISDEQAKELIETITRKDSEKPKSGKCYEVNLDMICENFEDGETVDIEALKEKRLISKKADRVKILARGVMTKRLTVIADKFSIQAVKMIGLAGGLAQKYED